MARGVSRPARPQRSRPRRRSVVGSDAAPSFDQPSAGAGALEHAADVIERVGLFGFLVGAPAEHAWEPHRNPGPMSRRRGDAFKAKLENVQRFDVANGAETFPRMAADPLVHLCNLFVRQTGIGFRDWDQLSVIPD